MKTLITESTDEAAEIIREGGLVAFPTETVYGLGADVFNERAVAKIFEAKRRPSDNPLIAHVSRVEQIKELATEVTEVTERLIEEFFPGPLTVVLKKSSRVPAIATAGLETIGIRMPRLDIAQRFLRDCETPLVAPSANISGRPSPTTWEAVAEDLDGRIDCILKSEATEIGIESTVVDCTGPVPILLRRGSISLDDLRRVVADTTAADAQNSKVGRSPGMRHRHYSPRARVKIIDPGMNVENLLYSGGRFAYIGVHAVGEGFVAVKVCSSADEYARVMYEFFRECDRLYVDEIFCDAIADDGVGAAVMDRIQRAAEGSS